VTDRELRAASPQGTKTETKKTSWWGSLLVTDRELRAVLPKLVKAEGVSIHTGSENRKKQKVAPLSRSHSLVTDRELESRTN